MTNVELIDKLNKSLVDDVQIDGEAIDILIDGYWDKIKNVPQRIHRFTHGIKWMPSCCEEADKHDIWLAEAIDFNYRLRQHNSAIKQRCSPPYFDGMYAKTFRNVYTYKEAVLDYNHARWDKYINKIKLLAPFNCRDVSKMENKLKLTEKEERSITYFHTVGGQYQ